MTDFTADERDMPAMQSTAKPSVGQWVRLAIDNSNSASIYATKLHRFMGRVINLPGFGYAADNFAVYVDGKHVEGEADLEGAYARVRVVRLHRVHSINGERVRFAAQQVELRRRPAFREFSVSGSKGNTYTVRVEDDRWTCNCPSFSFRHGPCKHITAQKAKP